MTIFKKAMQGLVAIGILVNAVPATAHEQVPQSPATSTAEADMHTINMRHKNFSTDKLEVSEVVVPKYVQSMTTTDAEPNVTYFTLSEVHIKDSFIKCASKALKDAGFSNDFAISGNTNSDPELERLQISGTSAEGQTVDVRFTTDTVDVVATTDDNGAPIVTTAPLETKFLSKPSSLLGDPSASNEAAIRETVKSLRQCEVDTGTAGVTKKPTYKIGS
jgi:hypothetical protein